MDALSLLRHQIASARRELAGVMADVTQEMARWEPPGKANSIMTLVVHTVVAQDRTVQSRIQGKPMLLEAWARRLNVPSGFRLSEETLQGSDVGLDLVREYWTGVDAATDDYLATLTDPAELDRGVEGTHGPTVLGHLLSSILATHAYEHIGEISTLKGLQGATGYAAI